MPLFVREYIQTLKNDIIHYERLFKLVNRLWIKDVDKGYLLDLLDMKMKELKYTVKILEKELNEGNENDRHDAN